MRSDIRESLESLIESSNQLHLTIYLQNRGDLSDIKRQIKDSLDDAQESLKEVLSESDRSQFLAPIAGLLEDARILKQLKGNIGIFRTRSDFRVLSLPVAVRTSCHLATTFHVKPLLSWMQWDSEFLLLGLGRDSAHLYVGSLESLRKIDTLLYPNRMTSLLERSEGLAMAETRELREIARKTYAWIGDWVLETVSRPYLKLFLIGEEKLTRHFEVDSKRSKSIHARLDTTFEESKIQEHAHRVRNLLKLEARARLESALFSFQKAEEKNLVKKNIREIAQAAAEGKVKKLVIAENREVFGKFDASTGRLVIHPFDLDHEDDDLLDDLAQTVLLSGGEVYVAQNEVIPSGRPILALLEDEPSTEVSALDVKSPGSSWVKTH